MIARSLRRVVAVILALAAGGGGAAFAAGPSPPTSLDWFKAAPAPAGWKLLVPPSGSSLLWYPPFMKPLEGDPYSVSVSFKDTDGSTLLYLNAGPQNGGEQLKGWPGFRIAHLHATGDPYVHEDARASHLAFQGGPGSCVIDDYVTPVVAHHYVEIACFVQGRKSGSVIVAAVARRAWARYGGTVERAVEAWVVQ